MTHGGEIELPVFTQNIGTPELPTILVQEFEHVYFTTYDVSKKNAGWMANSVDHDQTSHSAASDRGLHCLLRPVCSNT